MPNQQDHRLCPALRVLCVLCLGLVFAACGASLTTDVPPEFADPAEDTGTDPGAGAQLPEGHIEVPSEVVDTLFRSSASGVDDRRRAVIRTDEEWTSAWAELVGHVAPTPAVPDVDFDAHFVVLATMGTRPSGGFLVDVGQLSHASDTLRVVVHETSPGAGCVNTMALTHPAIVIRVPQVAENVAFVEVSTATNCS